jgi:hypothetical protein
MNVSKEGEKRMGETREGYIPVGSRECGKQSKTVPMAVATTTADARSLQFTSP